MAPLPINNTARLWLDYVTAPTGAEHTVLIRISTAAQQYRTEAQQVFLNVLNALGPAFFRAGWAVIRARVAEQNGDVSVPTTLLPALAAFVGTNGSSFTRDREAVEMRFVARSITGRRVSMSLYGMKPALALGNFRVEGGTSGDPLLVRNAAAALNAASGDVFIAIDSVKPVWYDYANIQYNSYWERRIRVTA